MLTRVEAPAVEPISLEEAREHLAVIGTSDNDLLERLISSATAAFDGPEGKLARCLISQTWRLDLPGFPVGNIRLPMPPVISVSDISFSQADGSTVVVAPSDYVVSGVGSTDHCTISPKTRWPSSHAVSIEFVAGFGDAADDVPQDIRDAILAVVGSRYAWREAQTLAQGSLNDNPEVSDVIDRWRVRGFG